MKKGTESKGKTIAAGVLGGLALILVLYNFMPSFGGTPAAPAVSPSANAPVEQASNPGPATTRKRPKDNRKERARLTIFNPLDPTIRTDLLASAENSHYEGSGRNIFDFYTPPPPAPPKPRPAPVDPNPMPPPPPPPPPINLKFYGFASKTGNQKQIFLSQGDQVFIAKEGDVVANRYKVVRIGQGTVEIEDILNNNRQSIPMS
jgi:hypothetical protein